MHCSVARTSRARAYFAARLALVVLWLSAGCVPTRASGARATHAQLSLAARRRVLELDGVRLP